MLGLMPAAEADSAQAARTVPQHGVFVVGKTLGGVGLGYTQRQVTQRWGQSYTVCTSPQPLCSPTEPVWIFIAPSSGDEPMGAGVRLRNGKTTAVFTIGTPGVNSLSAGGLGGWKTSEGLHTFDPISSINSLYPAATIQTACILYGALSMRQGGVTSSFYTSSGTVYGFALSKPNEPICA